MLAACPLAPLASSRDESQVDRFTVTQTPSTHPVSSGPEPETIPGLEDDAEGATIVREELKLLSTVRRAL